MKWTKWIALACLLAACNKVPLGTESNSSSVNPIFELHGQIDTSSVALIAGDNVVLHSYHEEIGGRSFVGMWLQEMGADTLLQLDFIFDAPFTTTSFDQPVDIGSLSFQDTLDVLAVPNASSLVEAFWVVDGVVHEDQVILSDFGEYDILLVAAFADGTFLLEDKLVVGSAEEFEPEIVVDADWQNDPNMIFFDVLNTPADVDSVVWYKQNGDQTLQYIGENPYYPTYFSNGRHVLFCEFYAEGSRINYKSRMFSVGTNPTFPLIHIDNVLQAVEDASIAPVSRGQVTVLYNGDSYRSTESYSGIFQCTNLESIVEEVTGVEYVKGDLILDTYLYNTVGDSIPVFFSGSIGLRKHPG